LASSFQIDQNHVTSDHILWRTKADWEKDQRELAEEQEGRNAIRNKKIPAYFDSEFGKTFLLSQVGILAFSYISLTTSEIRQSKVN
jgi:hypothetical protein